MEWKKILPLLFSKRFLEDPSRQKEVREWKRRLTANDRKAMVKFGEGILSRASVYDQLDQIKIPTLVIVGEADISTPKARAERIANRIPVAMLLVIPNAGHLCTVEAPAVVTSAIQEFVTAHIWMMGSTLSKVSIQFSKALRRYLKTLHRFFRF